LGLSSQLFFHDVFPKVGYTDTRKAQTAIHMVWRQYGGDTAVWAKAHPKNALCITQKSKRRVLQTKALPFT
jgi:hypothetical protein